MKFVRNLIDKKEILDNICYTPLVYGRINKKLSLHMSKKQIEELIFKLLKETPEKDYSKTGKNFYVFNRKNNVQITINSNTYRVITVDRTKE